MPAIELKLDKTSFGSKAYISFAVEAVGSTGYKFSGTLKVSCPFDRTRETFANTVRIGHGGVSGKYEHLDFDLGKTAVSDKTLTVEGEGKRAFNEKVEFYVAVNEGLSGQFVESPEVTCDLGVVADPVDIGIANKPDESVSARNAALTGSQTGPASSKSNFTNTESEGQDIRPTKTVRESVYVDGSENKKSI
ncbi:hypothetical protein [Pseudomonas sp. RC10]|uniref:hypothetical protein n=1 Tax=Pseudomonas bambusae TaxID=3139142 RepID=UPI0031395416